MESFAVVTEENIPDIENQLDKVSNNQLNIQCGLKDKYYKILQVGYSILSQIPVIRFIIIRNLE